MSLLLLFRPHGGPVGPTTHTASGTLVGAGAVVTGDANHIGLPPEVPAVIGGSGRKSKVFAQRKEPVAEVFHGRVEVSGGGAVFVVGHKAIEYPSDAEVLEFLAMV